MANSCNDEKIRFLKLSGTGITGSNADMELAYWRAKAGSTTGSLADNLSKYLKSLGYTGSLADMSRAWLAASPNLIPLGSLNQMWLAYWSK